MMKLSAMSAGIVSVLLCCATTATASDAAPVYKNPKAPLEARVDDLLVRLTLREKVSLMAGGSAFNMQAIERLGIPALHLSDGPNGVRSNDDVAATVFPPGVALAATWNPALLQSVGEAIGREARALDVHVLLGPNVNLQRVPLAGRNFEAYSEDPFLTGKLGVGYVQGVQSQGVGTSVKHYVANEQELNRMRGSSNVDERTLRELYLQPFEMIVKEAQPWTVMASYNRINGTYATEHNLLMRDVLKDEWGFDGLLMSDWGAVHSTVASANAGLDLEMPGPGRYFGKQLANAVRNWQVEEAAIDEAARRILRTIIRTGALDGRTKSGELRSERNRSVALSAAREAITLLRNDRQLLPLDRKKVRSIAVIGPNADTPLIQGGGSAAVIPATIPTPLASLKSVAGAGLTLTYAQGVDNDLSPPPADARLMSPDQGRTQQGLKVAYYSSADFSGSPVRSEVENYFDKTAIATTLGQMSARWEGYFWPPRDGAYQFGLSQLGNAALYLDERKIVGPDVGELASSDSELFMPFRTASVDLKSGQAYRLKIEYVSLPIAFHSMRFGVRLPPAHIDEAIQAAKNADVALVFVGVSRTSESEGKDRRDLELVGRQNELVEAVLAANPNTIVVLNNGAPLVMPWVERVPALLEAWLPGEQGANALAQVLFGDVNPSGKLPLTFPRRLEDNPTYLHYAGGRDTNYGEGVFVGYRYYDRKKIEPLFAFGHGLSYTTFEYGNLRVADNVPVGESIEVSVDVRNAGNRAGLETVQLYVGDEATTEVVRPVKELRAFEKIGLAPGEKKTLKFTLSARDLAYYDVHARQWVSTPGAYRIYLGSSSADIRLRKQFQWSAPQDPRRPPRERATLLDMF